MPAVRNSTTTEKTSELGENLCQALDLQKRRNIFNSIKHVLHQHVDQHFDLTVPSYEQKANMASFVDKIIQLFPGYFNNTHPNEKERIISLQAYAGSYLDEKLVEPSAKTTKSKKPQSSEARLLAKGDTIKALRPQPQPLYRSHKKKASVLDARNESPLLLPALPIDSDPPELSMTDVSEGDDFDYPVTGGKHRTSFVVYSPEPSTSPEPAVPTDPITEFCENCYPPMVHLAKALHQAGVFEKDHLVGMARWNDDTLREFLRNNDVARTPLEEQALLVGFSCVLSDASRPASAMSL